MTNKEAGMKYIIDEEIKFLGKPTGEMFIEPEENISGYDSIKVELISPITDQAYRDWINSAFYSSLCTWDTEPHNPVEKMFLELPFEEKEKRLFNILKERPISVALEGTTFTFRVKGLPRSVCFQWVRARQQAFGQESFRVSSCYSDSVRAPIFLIENIEKAQKENDGEKLQEFNTLLLRYSDCVAEARSVYKDLIDAGVPVEQSRNIMPMGTTTKIAATMRLRDLIEYFKSRTIDITMDEHTYLVCLLAKEVMTKQPKFWEFIKSKVPGIEKTMADYKVL